jgi:hypothetical protein
MAENKVQDVEVNESLLKAQGFWNKYQKPIVTAVVAVAVVVGGWFGYQSLVVKPKEEKAADAIFKAQQYFNMDSLNLALNGDGFNKGFLYIAKTFDGTEQGNLAKYYSGVCYLKTGDFNNAVKYLKDFSTPAKQVQMMAYGCLGDAYSELNKTDEAVDNYKKASATFEEDQVNASEYLFRAALKLETSGKQKEALELYKELKQKFPQTERGFQADKYIYRLSIEPNEFSSK